VYQREKKKGRGGKRGKDTGKNKKGGRWVYSIGPMRGKGGGKSRPGDHGRKGENCNKKMKATKPRKREGTIGREGMGKNKQKWRWQVTKRGGKKKKEGKIFGKRTCGGLRKSVGGKRGGGENCPKPKKRVVPTPWVGFRTPRRN